MIPRWRVLALVVPALQVVPPVQALFLGRLSVPPAHSVPLVHPALVVPVSFALDHSALLVLLAPVVPVLVVPVVPAPLAPLRHPALSAPA